MNKSFIEFLQEIAFGGKPPIFKDDGGQFDWIRKGSKSGMDWSRNKKDMYHLNQTVIPNQEKSGVPLKLGYGVYNVFQRYTDGQSDPLYHLLSRRGGSVDFVTVFASPEEAERLKAVAEEIIQNSKDQGEIRTAKSVLDL